jgi:hypothetical protein
MMFSKEHFASARDCFALNCPNCYAHYDDRTQKYGPARKFYGNSGFEFGGKSFSSSAYSL